MEQIDTLVATTRRVRAFEPLYRAGSPFKSLYAIRLGSFKTVVVSEEGREQVTGFQVPAELLGLDGVDNDTHTVTAVALEDSTVCVIPYARLEEVSIQVPALRRQIFRAMSREIVHDHDVMMMLGSMRAEQRVASFLLDLSRHHVARGYAASEFRLRMTREDIGSFLGMKLETVSRILSRFDEDELLTVQKRLIRILNIDGLNAVLSYH